jgi:hypothetical protein
VGDVGEQVDVGLVVLDRVRSETREWCCGCRLDSLGIETGRRGDGAGEEALDADTQFLARREYLLLGTPPPQPVLAFERPSRAVEVDGVEAEPVQRAADDVLMPSGRFMTRQDPRPR